MSMATALQATLVDNGPTRSSLYGRLGVYHHPQHSADYEPKDGVQYGGPMSPSSPRLDSRPGSALAYAQQQQAQQQQAHQPPHHQPHHHQQPSYQSASAPAAQQQFDEFRPQDLRPLSRTERTQALLPDPWDAASSSSRPRDDAVYSPGAGYPVDPRASQHESMGAYVFPPPGSPRRGTLPRRGTDDTLTRSLVASSDLMPAADDDTGAPAPIDGYDDGAYARRAQAYAAPAPRRPISTIMPGAPRHPSVPTAGAGAGSPAPIMPLAAPPSYTSGPSAPAVVNVSAQHRAYAQQPTYVTSPTSAAAYTPAPPPPPPEEVCVECAMRDQDMADVDVTSPGVWERESDAAYADLVRREDEDIEAGIPPSRDPAQPRSMGDSLTEPHVRIWLTMNPKEPQARQQTLRSYVKSQRELLEAEALAHAQALAESRSLENRVRDQYTQLRRSAHDAVPTDGGVRVRSPRSLSSPNGALGTSPPQPREVTVLENGLIVEHVDVRREEREERDRRRREERRERSRARKSSRSSGADANSVYSFASPVLSVPGQGVPATSPGAPTQQSDSGYYSNNLRVNPRNSQFSLLSRPQSVLSNSADQQRPGLPRAHSQSQYSLVESIGSPRRSRFFGRAAQSSGWKSQDSLAFSGISGSMVDMHVALQRDQAQQHHYPANELGSNTPTLRRMSEGYKAEQQAEEKAAKKKKGLAKIWKIVTGQSRAAGARGPDRTRSVERHEDDLPLAPPPPLSYLVSRSNRDQPRQHNTVPSLGSASSAAYPASPAGMSASPATAPSSLLPSPTSSARRSGPEPEHEGALPFVLDERSAFAHSRTMLSEPDMRASMLLLPMYTGEPQRSASPQRPAGITREKSLPPLPHELGGAQPRTLAATISDSRPATMFYGQTGSPPFSGSPTALGAPQAPFRTADTRRQSFGGMSSRPDLGLQTLPPPQSAPYAHPQFAAPYGEFGMSRRSLGRLDDMSTSYESGPAASATAPKKRKSRFGLTSLFGKKSSGGGSGNAGPVSPNGGLMQVGGGYATVGPGHGREYSFGGGNGQAAGYPYELAPPSHAPSSSEGRHDYGTARGWARSAQGGPPPPRMSVASRKAIEELVEQDREFVAYRYPSHDQGYEFER